MTLTPLEISIITLIPIICSIVTILAFAISRRKDHVKQGEWKGELKANLANIEKELSAIQSIQTRVYDLTKSQAVLEFKVDAEHRRVDELDKIVRPATPIVKPKTVR